MSESINVVGFFHTYAQDGELDPYMVQVAEAFEASGVHLHVLMANDLVHVLSDNEFHSGVSEDRLIDYINSLDPAFIFSTNRAGISQRIMSETSCPILTRMVDLIPFYHQGGDDQPLFCDRDYLLTPTSNSVSYWENKYPALKGKVHYVPFATDPSGFTAKPEQDINVSFVGTSFYCDHIINIFNAYSENSQVIRSLKALIQDVEDDFDLDFDSAVARHELSFVYKEFGINADEFKIFIANMISMNYRFKCLDAVADKGLKLYGTKNWVDVAKYSRKLLNCYQFGEFIKTREQLIDVYQRSKIALNVSHHQAVDGLPYRVFDVMASSALLITEYNKNSDLFTLFGQDMPVPMYKDERELRGLVEYYLENEDERLNVVNKCNLLIAHNHSFCDRVRGYFQVLGMPAPEPDVKGGCARIERSEVASTRAEVAEVVIERVDPSNYQTKMGVALQKMRSALPFVAGSTRVFMLSVLVMAARVMLKCLPNIVLRRVKLFVMHSFSDEFQKGVKKNLHGSHDLSKGE